jgi:uncharacterized membrane protein
VEPTVARHPAVARIDLLTPLLLVVLVAGSIVFLWTSAPVQIYLTVHVVAAVVWVGGGAALTALALLTQRSRDVHALANVVRQIELIATRIFTPASLVTLGFGIAVVQKYGLGNGTFWIEFSLAVWALSFVSGATLIGPRTARLRRPIDERGADDPRVERGITRVLRLACVDVTMLLLVVVDMVAKPTF